MICVFSNVGKESQQWWRLHVFYSTTYKIKGLNGLLCTFKKTESEEIQFLLGETPCFLSDKIASMLWYHFFILFYFILLFSTLFSTIALKWLLMFSLFACPLLFVCLFFFATPLPKLSKTNCELCRFSPGNFLLRRTKEANFKRERLACLAYSASQSEHRISLILPMGVASYIISSDSQSR